MVWKPKIAVALAAASLVSAGGNPSHALTGALPLQLPCYADTVEAFSAQSLASAGLMPHLGPPQSSQVTVVFVLIRAADGGLPPQEGELTNLMGRPDRQWEDPLDSMKVLYRFTDVPGELISHTAAALDLRPLPGHIETASEAVSVNRAAAARAGVNEFFKAFQVYGRGVRISMHEFAAPQANHPYLTRNGRARLDGDLKDISDLRAAFTHNGVAPMCSDIGARRRDRNFFRLCHATHVMGTLAAGSHAGEAEGMARQATVTAALAFRDLNDWREDGRRRLLRQVGVSNHSYAHRCGGVGEVACAAPDTLAETYVKHWVGADETALNQAALAVFAAGNNRHKFPDNLYACGGDRVAYGTVAGPGAAKNVLTVGSMLQGVSQRLSRFSDVGPTYDGRIKPEIVANGEALYSIGVVWDEADPLAAANARFDDYGSSMATSVVAGVGALLQSLALDQGLEMVSSYGLKALLIQGACAARFGEPNPRPGRCAALDIGPSYETGFGALDALTSGCALAGQNGGFADRLEIIPGDLPPEPILLVLPRATAERRCAAFNGFAATLTWIDDPGVGLQQDLDLRLVSPSGEITYFPWALNPRAPSQRAARGYDRLNTVEKITIPAEAIAAEPGEWRLIVSAERLNRPVNFSLAWSGMVRADDR